MVSEEARDPQGVHVCGGRYCMDLLRESVYHDQDGVVTFGLREFTYKVCGDYLPPPVWDSIGHKGANWASREGFGSVTE